MKEINIKANAKINWSLDVIGKRNDGYHSLDMILQSVKIYDDLYYEKSDKILITSNNTDMPLDERNIVWRTVKEFSDIYGINAGIKVNIKKNIPIEAGMAGGSADAAATLEALYRLYEIDDTPETKSKIALRLGADVPFMLTGGLARIQGIGEIIENHNTDYIYDIVIIKPSQGASTARIFSNLNLNNIVDRPDNDDLINSLKTHNIKLISKSMINVLQNITIQFIPDVKYAIDDLLANGAVGAVMTGSGSAVYGVFADKASAQTAYENICTKYRFACLTQTCSKGLVL